MQFPMAKYSDGRLFSNPSSLLSIYSTATLIYTQTHPVSDTDLYQVYIQHPCSAECVCRTQTDTETETELKVI